ncbi:MAG: cupredoxin domain-containing protein [Patescibacteria group bacterium]|mgnify:FL=1
MDKILVTLGGVGVIGLIWWFFFGKQGEAVVAGETIDILVDGGYKPENIKIKKDKTTKLIFERKDPNSCLEEIIIPDFKIKEYLPLNKKVEIVLSPGKAGIYPTHCGMGMFHGKIIVE